MNRFKQGIWGGLIGLALLCSAAPLPGRMVCVYWPPGENPNATFFLHWWQGSQSNVVYCGQSSGCVLWLTNRGAINFAAVACVNGLSSSLSKVLVWTNAASEAGTNIWLTLSGCLSNPPPAMFFRWPTQITFLTTTNLRDWTPLTLPMPLNIQTR